MSSYMTLPSGAPSCHHCSWELQSSKSYTRTGQVLLYKPESELYKGSMQTEDNHAWLNCPSLNVCSKQRFYCQLAACLRSKWIALQQRAKDYMETDRKPNSVRSLLTDSVSHSLLRKL